MSAFATHPCSEEEAKALAEQIRSRLRCGGSFDGVDLGLAARVLDWYAASQKEWWLRAGSHEAMTKAREILAREGLLHA